MTVSLTSSSAQTSNAQLPSTYSVGMTTVEDATNGLARVVLLATLDPKEQETILENYEHLNSDGNAHFCAVQVRVNGEYKTGWTECDDEICPATIFLNSTKITLAFKCLADESCTTLEKCTHPDDEQYVNLTEENQNKFMPCNKVSIDAKTGKFEKTLGFESYHRYKVHEATIIDRTNGLAKVIFLAEASETTGVPTYLVQVKVDEKYVPGWIAEGKTKEQKICSTFYNSIKITLFQDDEKHYVNIIEEDAQGPTRLTLDSKTGEYLAQMGFLEPHHFAMSEDELAQEFAREFGLK